MKISPVTRTKNEARTNYNRLSRWYDWIASSEAKFRQIGVKAINLQPGESILEIGFGTGTCLADFAKQVGPKGLACGIDLSDGMAKVAQAKILELGCLSQTGIALADAAKAPFAPKSFDAVFMSFTLELFDTPEIPIVLEQSRRLLKPAGRLVVVSLVKTEKPQFAEQVYEWFHAKMPAAVDCRPINGQGAIKDVGFEITNVIAQKMWGLPIEIICATR